MTSTALVFLAALFLPVLLVILDVFGGLRARHKNVLDPDGSTCNDFEILVPIYGSLRYLENVDYLARYGPRVILCTTAAESDEFNLEIDGLAHQYGFRVFRARARKSAGGTGARATSGTLRDRIIRDAHTMVTAEYVVCIDADTITERPLNQLVGAMRDRDYDFVSVRLVPSNADTILARLQAHEYYLAMLLRRIMPWMVSGACHAARSVAHRDVMEAHSLFFQGNDIEAGILADKFGYSVGHIPFDVPTTVPSTWKPWIRQRLAWAGGEVRLFVGNPQIALRHPFFWFYGAIMTIAGFPLRWWGIAHTGWLLAAIPFLYLGMLAYIQRGRWDRYLLLMPFYAALSSLVLTPIGLVYYVKMALADNNWGMIRTQPRVASNGRHFTPKARWIPKVGLTLGAGAATAVLGFFSATILNPAGVPQASSRRPAAVAAAATAPAIPACAKRIQLGDWREEFTTARRPDFTSPESRFVPGTKAKRLTSKGSAAETGVQKVQLFKITDVHSVKAGWKLTFQLWVSGEFTKSYGFIGIEAFDSKYRYLSENDVDFRPTKTPQLVTVDYVTPERTSHVAVYMQSPEQYPTSAVDLTLDDAVLYAVKARKGVAPTCTPAIGRLVR